MRVKPVAVKLHHQDRRALVPTEARKAKMASNHYSEALYNLRCSVYPAALVKLDP